MRKRFRGNQPISTSGELEGYAYAQGTGGTKGEELVGEKPKQLYGGREAFGVPVREEGKGMGKGLGFDPEEKSRGL